MFGMTAYSSKEFSNNEVNIITEIKSVNSRFLDINVNLPYYLNSIEMNIRELIKENIGRGKVDVSVNIKLFDNLTQVMADLKLAKKYIDNLNLLIKEFDLKDEVRLFHLTKYDDIISVEKNKDYNQYWKIISQNLTENIKEVITMKKKEGEAIKKDLMSIIKDVKKNLDIIIKKIPKMEKDIYTNTKNKINEFLQNKIDEIRLMNEAAVIITRSCINEEVQRLNSHIDHFLEIIEEKTDVGKRLDFICQEMHREINTIGSKITLTELTGNVISIKNDIEKMREQIRNTE